MPFVEITGDKLFPLFCNVHVGVGKAQPNQRLDVMLVQYLLKACYSAPSAFSPPLSPPAGPPLQVTGHMDAVTANYIEHFQARGKSKGKAISVDGKVNRAVGFFGTLTGNQYTITYLNNAFAKARPEAGRHVWMANDCPPQLRDALIAASKPKVGPMVVETHGGGV
jgi:hypothetical protein